MNKVLFVRDGYSLGCMIRDFFHSNECEIKPLKMTNQTESEPKTK